MISSQTQTKIRHYDGFFFLENLLPAGEKVHFVAKKVSWEGPALFFAEEEHASFRRHFYKNVGFHDMMMFMVGQSDVARGETNPTPKAKASLESKLSYQGSISPLLRTHIGHRLNRSISKP